MNARELSAVIWLGAFVVAALCIRDFRRAIPDLLKTFASPSILVPFGAMVAYIVGLVYLGSRTGLWKGALLTDTIFWFVLGAFGLFDRGISLFDSGNSVKRLLLAALGAAVLVEGFVNLYVLPLPVELVLVPVVLGSTLLATVASHNEDQERVAGCINGFLTIFGLALIVYVVIELATGWEDFDEALGARKLALPIWLTLGLVPFLGLLGLWSKYSTALSRIRYATKNRRRRRVAGLALVLGLHVRARELGSCDGVWVHNLVDAPSFGDARAVIRQFRRRTRS